MRDPIDIFIGKKIRKERRKARLSQAAMAEEIGVSFQQLQKYESAQNRVSGSRIWHIAFALDVPISTFFPPVHIDEVSLPEIDDPD